MQLKTVIISIAVMAGVLIGITALLWNFSNQAEMPIEGVAGEMRQVKSFGVAQDHGREGGVVVTEWSDFQCPACAGAQKILKELLTKYEGKVKLVYRHLPIPSIHKNALVSAYAAEAAGRQGKFWEMHDILYERQTEWGGLGDPRERFAQYGEELGLARQEFVDDLNNQEVKELVNKDMLEATKYRIQSTPSFFVNGVRVETAQLGEEIEKALGQ